MVVELSLDNCLVLFKIPFDPFFVVCLSPFEFAGRTVRKTSWVKIAVLLPYFPSIAAPGFPKFRARLRLIEMLVVKTRGIVNPDDT